MSYLDSRLNFSSMLLLTVQVRTHFKIPNINPVNRAIIWFCHVRYPSCFGKHRFDEQPPSYYVSTIFLSQ